jgi:hypothetical protein
MPSLQMGLCAVYFLNSQLSKTKEDSTVKIVGSMLLLIGMGSAAFATVSVPEISPASAGSALALVSGALLVMRGRRKK